MTEPKWVTRQQVEFIHEAVIEMGGGSHGLRDAALLESALARPQNQHAYGENDTFQLAASYAEAIARNHAFVDGNKRTAFYAASDFLEQNGHELQAAKGIEHAEMMEQLGQGKISREDAAAHLREHSRQIEQERSAEEPPKKDWGKKPSQTPVKKAPVPKRDIDRDR
jgi:death-on-curing protein